jgi:hypothetical protein
MVESSLARRRSEKQNVLFIPFFPSPQFVITIDKRFDPLAGQVDNFHSQMLSATV